MPIDNRMHPHEARPPLIRLIEMRQRQAVRIGPPRAHQDRLDAAVLLQVHTERLAHRHRIPRQVQPVHGRGLVHEGVDLGKRVRRHDVHGLQGARERPAEPRQRAQQENQQHQAVLASVVRERDLIEAAPGPSVSERGFARAGGMGPGSRIAL